jgi:hypothetical protein
MPELIPSIRQLYQEQVKQVTGNNRKSKIAELKRQLAQLRDEEARLGRLVIMNKITEDTYDRLRAEWKEKLRKSEISLAEMESESKAHFDGLDVALILMSKLPELFPRFKEADRTKLLKILARRIIVDPNGEIVGYDLNSPFMYLDYLANDLRGVWISSRGSSDVSLGVPKRTRLELRDIAVNEFLEMLRFEQRGKLAELPTEVYERVRDECYKYTKCLQSFN